MRRVVAILAVGLVVLGACGSDDSSDKAGVEGGDRNAATEHTEADATDLGVPSCGDWLQRPVTVQEVDSGCADGNSVQGTAVNECEDGRVLYWNDSGWGYVGEPMHAHAPGAEKVPPAADLDACPG